MLLNKFTSITCYDIEFSIENENCLDIEEKLRKYACPECKATDTYTYGWTSPFLREDTSYLHKAGNFLLFAFVKMQKKVPSSVLKDYIKQQCIKIESEQVAILPKIKEMRLKNQRLSSSCHKHLCKKMLPI